MDLSGLIHRLRVQQKIEQVYLLEHCAALLLH